jgi:RNA polymerase sigma-70 factor (ECF subfamily)
MDDQSDEHLLACFRGGDARAFEELVRRHQTPLLRHVRAILGSRAQAEDVVQETLMKLVASPPTVDGARAPRGDGAAPRAEGAANGLTLGAWLHTVARNACLDELRSSARRASRESARALMDRRGVETDDVEHSDVRAAVERGIARLPDDQREVLVLRLLGERSYREIAAITGRKIGTVGWLVSEGLARLADELGPLLGLDRRRDDRTRGAVDGGCAAGAPAIDDLLTENPR